jgi:Cu/Ag efflux pump CusA
LAQVPIYKRQGRVQTITLNVAGGNVDAFVQSARKQIAAKVALAPGNYIQFGGTAAAQGQSRRDLLVHSAIAALGIVLLLSIVLTNWRNLLLVLANLPFALVGGVLAVFAGGGMLSLGAMVGFVTLFGITLRNSIMLISHYEHLVVEVELPFGERSVAVFRIVTLICCWNELKPHRVRDSRDIPQCLAHKKSYDHRH